MSHQTPDSGGHQRGHCGLYGRRGGLPDGGGGFCGRGPGSALKPLGPGRAFRGHAAQAADAAAEFEVAVSYQLSATVSS